MNRHGIMNFPRLKKLLVEIDTALGNEFQDASSANIFNPEVEGNPPLGISDLIDTLIGDPGREQ